MMIAPHSSCRYALLDEGTKYTIVAVHGVTAGDGWMLVSAVSALWADRLAFSAPFLVETNDIIGMAANFKAAYGLLQDREAKVKQ